MVKPELLLRDLTAIDDEAGGHLTSVLPGHVT